jgi:hypothetical protein
LRLFVVRVACQHSKSATRHIDTGNRRG